MAGFSDKIKKITSVLSKKGKNKGGDSPFDSDAPPFLQGGPDLGSVPDLAAGMPPSPAGPPGAPATSGAPDAPGFPPGMAPPGVDAGGPPGASTQAAAIDNEMLEENRKKIKEVESKVSKADVTLNMVQRDNEEIRKTVDKIDQSVLELLSLYEIVSNQVNPFVGDDVNSRDTIERFEKTEKRLTEMGDMLVLMKNDFDATAQKMTMPQGISEEAESRMHNIESKMDAFADAMVMMHESIEQLTSKTDELAERTDSLDRNLLDIAETTSAITSRLEELESRPEPFVKGQANPSSKTKDKSLSSDNQSESDEVAGPELESEKGSETELSPKAAAVPLVRLECIKADPTSVVVLLNWIEFLMERVGRNNLMDALDYYVDIGWISEDVMSEIMAYARGIDYYVEKPTWRLLPEDHTKSLLFIERLSGRKIDRNMLSSIDREMAKVKHGLEELYGI
ncbi:FlaD/FlaE family flagellar protein [Methanolobus bombayensis]|uniref:FlaD/FlaE family flagellar protein n=1 Tax=Methanolobus bombayensis TaxID=38023 RepID=UPI001AE420F3|nr:FlaD/FlaE family flagellar protein [Methanolobus bombayensis]MBP1908176.1 flagellar protein FlaD [Methanolobus bombayensis]